jgi:hypothetical protein
MAPRYVNPLAAALVTDPANPPDLVFIRGFVGPVDDETITRIFRNQVMNRFVDVPNDQIVHMETGLPVPASPWPEDVVWVTRADGDNLREAPVNLAVGALPTTRGEATYPSTAAGTVLTINVGGGGSGPSSTGGDGGPGGGGATNWNQQWP